MYLLEVAAASPSGNNTYFLCAKGLGSSLLCQEEIIQGEGRKDAIRMEPYWINQLEVTTNIKKTSFCLPLREEEKASIRCLVKPK